jgi:glutamate dehydrogenase (NAD(P)+)
MWTLAEINERLRRALTDAFDRAFARAERHGLDMRTSALVEGIARVTEAKLVRGVFP